MPQTRNRVSDAAVKSATGKTWPQWYAALDRLGAKTMTHREIARMLQERGLIDSGWWCQMVTTGYEYARQKRVVGKTLSAGFEIGVQKTLPVPPERLWSFLMSQNGTAIWLGDGLHLELRRGARHALADGGMIEIRTLDLGRKLRLRFQPRGFKNPSTLQLYFEPSGRGTALSFHQEKLPSAAARETMRKHWRGVMARIHATLLAQRP